MKTLASLAVIALLPLSSSALSINVGLGASTTASSTGASLNASSSLDVNANSWGEQNMNSAQVSSEADLQVWSESLESSNENVANIELKEDRMDVEYRHPGKFLGFLPVKVKASTSAVVSEDGNIEIKTSMPWWNVFVSGTDEVSSSVDERLAGATLTTNMEASGETALRAKIIEAIVSAHAETDVSAKMK